MSSDNSGYKQRVVESPLHPEEKDDLRERVLRASVSLIEEEGLASLSMREVARRAGVSHQAPYHYFPDRESILAAVAERGFELLHERMQQARSESSGATDALERTAIAYVTFACDYPAHFRIMFRPELVTLANHHEADCCADAAFKHVPEMVIDCMKAGFPEDVGIEVMSTLLWSIAHGFACLLIDGPLGEKVPSIVQDREKLVRAVAHAARRMVDATITVEQSKK